MTARRFYTSSDPQRLYGPLQPMDRTDAEFWRLRAERKQGQRPATFIQRLLRRA